MFFAKGQTTNQGQWFDFDEKDLISAMLLSVERAKVNNFEGEKLKEWTFEKTANTILENII
jgi:hypothetical protein